MWWTGAIPLAIAVIGAAYASVVLKGNHTRDNRVFGALALVDAGMTAWRGITVLTGGSIIAERVLVFCTLGTIVLTVLTLEFLYSFPRRRGMPRWLRLGLVLWASAAFAIALRTRHLTGTPDPLIEGLFFAPATLLIFVAGGASLRCIARAPRTATTRAEQVVVGMLMFRWVVGFGAYFIAPLLGAFEPMVWFETTVASLLGFVVVGTSVLRTELFSIKQSVSEVITIATLSLLVIFGGGAAVAAAIHLAPRGPLQSFALFLAAFVPLALASLGKRMYPRLERRVLAPLDDRRARRLGAQADPLPTSLDQAIAEGVRRLAHLTDDPAVRWMFAEQLPAAVCDHVAQHPATDPIRRDVEPELFACLVAPALATDGALLGALVIDRGVVDRDTYLVARDLAARIGLVVERTRAVSALEDARRLAALGQFAAAIAHDIRTPLTSISLNVQIIRRKLQMTADDAEHLDIALEELARLDRSVAEILDFAKPVRLDNEAIDVGELLENTTKNLSPVLQEKQIALRCERSSPTGGTILGDRTRLRQVLVNLVDNAADASTPGAEVTLRATAELDGIAIEVIDRGRGIAPADLAHIFEPFYTTRADGTGLGLAIVHKVITAHGGRIDVKSAPAEGSTFTIRLPLAPTPSPPAP